MKSLTLHAISKVDGTIILPGSKSISNRALLLAALANGTTVITNLLNSHDTYYMLNTLKRLGIHYKLSLDRTYCKIIGNNGAFIANKKLQLFLGNAGTVMRPMTAVLCLGKNNVILTGEKRMKERPINHLVDALRQGGAEINYIEKENYPPLHLHGKFIGGDVTINGSISSQFLTALLIAAPLAPKKTTITIKGNLVSQPYVDITLNLMKTFGILVKNQGYQRFVIYGNQKYQSPGSYCIEGDASSASYFLAAAAIKGGTVKVIGIDHNSIQGDIFFANILENMGATIIWGDGFISCTHSNLIAIDMDMNHIPDAAMTIAVTALFAKGTTTIRNIYNWQMKETNRLFAMSTELRKLGALVKAGKDFIRISSPPTILPHVKIDTYNDHRMAMCFSLIALSGTSVTILNPQCVSKTFPNYFEQLVGISKLT